MKFCQKQGQCIHKTAAKRQAAKETIKHRDHKSYSIFVSDLGSQMRSFVKNKDNESIKQLQKDKPTKRQSIIHRDKETTNS